MGRLLRSTMGRAFSHGLSYGRTLILVGHCEDMDRSVCHFRPWLFTQACPSRQSAFGFSSPPVLAISPCLTLKSTVTADMRSSEVRHICHDERAATRLEVRAFPVLVRASCRPACLDPVSTRRSALVSLGAVVLARRCLLQTAGPDGFKWAIGLRSNSRIYDAPLLSSTAVVSS